MGTLAVLVVLQHAVHGAVHRADHEGVALSLLRTYLDNLQTHQTYTYTSIIHILSVCHITTPPHLSISVLVVHRTQVSGQLRHQGLIAVKEVLLDASLLEPELARPEELTEVKHTGKDEAGIKYAVHGGLAYTVVKVVDPPPSLIVGVCVGHHEAHHCEVRQLLVGGSHGVSIHLRQ